MSEQEDENELDKAFRSGIEKMRLVPPPVVWDGVRAAALQQQLFRYQSFNNWLKILSGCLGVALVGCIYFLGNKESSPPNTKTVFVTKTDTVYVTKTEKVFVPMNEKNTHQLVPEATENLADNSIKVPNETSLSNQPIENNIPTVSKEKYEEKYTLNTVNAPLVKSANEDKISKKIAEKAGVSANPSGEERITRKTTEKVPLSGGEKISKNANQSNTDKSFVPSAETPSVLGVESSSVPGGVESISSPGVESAPVGSETDNKMASERKILLTTLVPKNIEANPFGRNLPPISVKSRNRIPARFLKSSAPIWSKISLSGYYSRDATSLTQQFQTPTAQLQLEEKSHNNFTYGFRVGYDISPKVTLLTGIEQSSSDYLSGDNKQFLVPDIYKGSPVFQHRTSFGTSYIPSNGNNQVIHFGPGGDHHVLVTRIPLLVKFDFYNQRKSVYGSSYHPLKFYAIGGFYWNSSLKQQLPSDIYDQNGRESHITLTDFRGVQRNSFGISVGLGMEYNFLKKWSFYLEPTYKTDISPIIKDLQMETYISSFSISGGLKFQFGK